MTGKRFSIKVKTNNFPNLTLEFYRDEVHFGVPWSLRISKNDETLEVSLVTSYHPKHPWSIDLDYKFLLKSEPKPRKNSTGQSTEYGGWEWTDSYNWEDIIKNEVITDKCFTIECQVEIKKMSGIAPKRIINFDKPLNKSKDMMVLKVGEKKFNVLHSLLGFRSPYFNTMFYGSFVESTQSEVELKEIDADDFQRLLEVIYGESKAIQMENVEGVLKLADQFDVSMAREKCEEFLAEIYGPSMRLQLRLAYEYSLEKLKMKCFELLSFSEEVNKTQSDMACLSYTEVLELYEKSLKLDSICTE